MSLSAIYIHIPFCAKHCAYCDFNTYVEKQQSGIVQATVDAICVDIERTSSAHQGTRIDTVFFGGGTPTFLTGSQIASILSALRNHFDIAQDAEISSEANPGSSDAEKFAALHSAGFNRLSIGVQSFDDGLLIALDRFHTSTEAERALAAARAAGFTNINLDLMFGLPNQTLELWNRSLDRAVSLGVEHLSLYALTLEPGTRFERRHSGGKLPLPDEDTELAMYETCIERLQTAGYEQYEVSNFSVSGRRCRHNQVYWRNEEYLGFGPGAVSYVDGQRYKRERLPQRYASKVAAQADLTVESEQLAAEGALGETMMLGLRLREGLNADRVGDRFGIDPLILFAEQIGRLVKMELMTVDGREMRLTHRGLLLANTVLGEFLPG